MLKHKHCALTECAVCDFIILMEEIRDYYEMMDMLGMNRRM